MRPVRVSVVVPARNEAHNLPHCLAALANQWWAPDEVIVADNGSADSTASVARGFGCRVVFEPVPGVGHARRQGCAVSSGDIVASLDADTIVDDTWLAKIVTTFAERPECVAVTGPWRLYDGPPWQRWAIDVHGRLFQRVLAAGVPALVNLTGCNSAFRADAYWKAGGFRGNLTLGEDLDLSLRLRAIGRVYFRPDLTVWTSARRLRGAFMPTIGAYLHDTARQLTPYLLGRRSPPPAPCTMEVDTPSISPSAEPPEPTEVP